MGTFWGTFEDQGRFNPHDTVGFATKVTKGHILSQSASPRGGETHRSRGNLGGIGGDLGGNLRGIWEGSGRGSGMHREGNVAGKGGEGARWRRARVS